MKDTDTITLNTYVCEQGGQIACERHIGGYALDAARRGDARIDTPLNRWVKITSDIRAEMEKEWAQYGMSPDTIECESCRFSVKGQ